MTSILSLLRQKAVFTVIAFIVATVTTLLLWDAVFYRVPFALYFAAVSLAAWRAGWVAGIGVAVAGVLSVAAHQQSPTDLLLPSLILLAVSVVISLLAAARERALSAMRDSERHYRLMVENVRDYALFMTDAKGKVTKWNVGAERVLGWQGDEIIGEPASLIFTPEDREAHTCEKEMEKAMRDGHAADERWHLRKDGSRFFAVGMMMRVDDEAGRHIGFTKVLRDMTERVRANEAKRMVEFRWQRLVEQSPLSVQVFSPDGGVRQVNRAWERLWGITLADVPGYNILQDPQLAASGVMARFERAFAGEPVAIDPVPYTLDRGQFAGRLRWVGAYVYPVKDDSGRVEEVVLVHEDVTERRHAEEALRASEARYRRLVETANEGIWTIDGQGRTTYVNQRMAELLGYAPEEMIERPHTDFMWESDRPKGDLDMDLRRRGEAAVWDQRYRRKDGSELWTVASCTTLYDTDGTFAGVLGMFTNITDRRRAEEALRESEERFRKLADAMPQMVWVTRPDGFHEYFNHRWYEFTGVANGSTDGEGWNGMFHPEDQDRAWAAWRHSLATGEPYEMEYRLRHRSGEYRWTLGRALPIKDTNEQIAKWFGTCTDIDTIKRLQEEHKRLLESERTARAEAERASHMKDEFLATLSHELRTPLSAILGWSQILSRGNAKLETLKEGLNTIERNARAQTQIIEDLLDMSRIISGKIVLNSLQTNLAAIIRAATQTVAAAATAKQIEVRFAAPSTSRYAVLGDPNRLQQVFWNLLSNAIKFTPRGGIVQVSIEQRQSQWKVEVSDNGEGITEEFLPYVFEKFRQQDGSTTRRHGGLGLGLAIVKQLVELHGGTVCANSAGAGRGAVFTVSLPVSAVHAQTDRASGSDKFVTSESGEAFGALIREGNAWDLSASEDLSGKKVLVVDDEADARALLLRLLSDCNAIVVVASSAEEALDFIARERPDVLVSDIGMPGEDGYELIRRVRNLSPEKGGSIPAIALTAYARTEDRVNAVRAGFQMHVPKPVEPAELIAMVASLAGRDGR